MKYTNKDLNKLSGYLLGVVDQLAAREINNPRFKDDDRKKLLDSLQKAASSCRAIANGLAFIALLFCVSPAFSQQPTQSATPAAKTATAPKKEVKQSVQCEGLTKMKERCKRKTTNASHLCFNHEKK